MDKTEQYKIQLPGKINVYNALAGIALLRALGFPHEQIMLDLAGYLGIKRRFEYVGKKNGITLIDDYAHHPTEIQATLKAVKQKYDGKKLRVVFHPHTFSRTEALIDDFAESFSKADEVIVLNIYSSAREEKGEITGEQVAEYISQNLGPKKTVKYLATLEEVEQYLRATTKEGDIILLMGAGDVFRIGERLVKNND
jgi:UDP-N-acetylmuramate--alanine ligase